MVTIETVKFIQAIFIAHDKKMYVAKSDTMVQVQSSNLNEELGQVSYVFSDKTGTLTCNEMIFKKLIVHGTPYGLEQDPTCIKSMPKVTNVDFSDPKFFKDLANPKKVQYLKFLAICHGILTEEKDLGNGQVFLIGQIQALVLGQHPQENRVCARRMCGAIKLQRLTDRIGMRRQTGEGFVHTALRHLLEEEVQSQIHVVGGALHRRGGHDSRDGDPLVAVDIAVNAAQIDEKRREAQRQEAEDDSEGEEKFLSDRTVMEPAHAGLV
mgnify:CR=1 FL=1